MDLLKERCYQPGCYALGVCEDRATLVQKIVNTELDPSFDDPAERAVVMIDDVVDEKRIVKL